MVRDFCFIRKCYVLLFPDGIELIADFLGRCCSGQGNDDDCRTGHQECREQFVDSPDTAHRLDAIFPTNTMTPPATMPAMAPGRLLRFQNRANSVTGPKDAPKPAQAKETMVNTELSGFHARTTATNAMPITVSLAARMEVLVSILIFKKS